MRFSRQDYDFSEARPDDFVHEPASSQCVDTVNMHVMDALEKRHTGFKEMFWNVLDEFIGLQACEVYRYVSDLDSDVFAAGKLFSFNFFLVNRRRQRLAFITCAAVSNLHASECAHRRRLESMMDMEESGRDTDDGTNSDDECRPSSWIGPSLILVSDDQKSH
jgi:hypothetical protein